MTYVVVVESHFSESNGAESEFGCPVSRISRNLGSWPSGISDFQDSWSQHFLGPTGERMQTILPSKMIGND